MHRNNNGLKSNDVNNMQTNESINGISNPINPILN